MCAFGTQQSACPVVWRTGVMCILPFVASGMAAWQHGSMEARHSLSCTVLITGPHTFCTFHTFCRWWCVESVPGVIAERRVVHRQTASHFFHPLPYSIACRSRLFSHPRSVTALQNNLAKFCSSSGVTTRVLFWGSLLETWACF